MSAPAQTHGTFRYLHPSEVDRSDSAGERKRLAEAARYEPVLRRWRHRCSEGLIDESGKIRNVFTKVAGDEDNVTRVIREINEIPEAVAELEEALAAQDEFTALSRCVVDMPVRNARLFEHPSLHDNGFVMRRHRSEVGDWSDDAAIERVYYPEIEALVQRETGAEWVFSANHLRRQSEPEVGGNGPLARLMAGSRGPAQVVHNDFAESYGEGIVNTVAAGGAPHTQTFGMTGPLLDAGIAADELAERRLLVINTWRSVAPGPLRRFPLGLVDRRTVARERLVPTLIGHAPSGTPRGGIDVLNAEYDPGNEWWYYPELTPDEVLLWKGYDSAETPARPTLHSAFDDPHSPDDAPERMSIEVRVLCVMPR